MKKQLMTLTLGLALLAMIGCGGPGKSSLDSKVDLHILENQEEVKKIYDEIVVHLGKQASGVDEIDILITNPDEAMVKRADDVVELSLRLDMMHPEISKKLQRTCYWSKYGGWQNPETMEVELSSTSSAAEKENFRLEDHLWSFTDNVKYEIFSKVLADAFATKDTPDKFSYRYIQGVNIDSEGYSVSINAKLASNDQKVNEYYDYDFNGNLLK